MEIIGPVGLYIIAVLGVVGGLAYLIDKNAQCHERAASWVRQT